MEIKFEFHDFMRKRISDIVLEIMVTSEIK